MNGEMEISTKSGPAFVAKATEVLDLEIQDLSAGGSGVARDHQGRVIFVPLTAPGDQVRVRITGISKRYAEAELIEVLRPSPLRATPPCAVFGRCGGCQWQHIPYSLQWSTKVRGVHHALKRKGIEWQGEWDELPAEQIFGYRNRIQLRGYKNQLGFYARASNDPVVIDRCEIARPEINARLPAVKEEGLSRDKPYKIEIEVLPDGKIQQSWNAPHAATGFRQVHDEQNQKLLSWVRDALTPGSVLLDLYGGSGNLSLPLACRMEQIHCVDVGSPPGRSVAKNLSFHRSAVLPWLIRARARGLRADSAILDPPREGLGEDHAEILVALRNMGVREAVAVGCNIDAWAQDLSRFIRRGWGIRRLALLDLFPQTPHVEGVALLLDRV